MLVPYNDAFRGTLQIDADDEEIRSFLSRVANSQAMRFQSEYICDQVAKLRKHLMDGAPRMTPEQVADRAADAEAARAAEVDRRVQAEFKRQAKDKSAPTPRR